MIPFWKQTEGENLAQGDYLIRCPIPVFPASYSEDGEIPDILDVQLQSGDLIVATHSCDLENDKVDHVSLCLIHSLTELTAINPKYRKADERENVRRGKYEALHMLAMPGDPSNLEGVLIVDFRRVISLPTAYLKKHAAGLGPRWRLNSPYLEHFSQAFARFFMRVGLPSAIPSFKPKKGG